MLLYRFTCQKFDSRLCPGGDALWEMGKMKKFGIEPIELESEGLFRYNEYGVRGRRILFYICARSVFIMLLIISTWGWEFVVSRLLHKRCVQTGAIAIVSSIFLRCLVKVLYFS